MWERMVKVHKLYDVLGPWLDYYQVYAKGIMAVIKLNCFYPVASSMQTLQRGNKIKKYI